MTYSGICIGGPLAGKQCEQDGRMFTTYTIKGREIYYHKSISIDDVTVGVFIMGKMTTIQIVNELFQGYIESRGKQNGS